MAFNASDTQVTIITSGGLTRVLEGFDTIDLTVSQQSSLVFAADGTGRGVRVITGTSAPDTVTLNMTDLSQDSADFIQDLALSGERVNVTIIDNRNTNKIYQLLNAVLANDRLQGSISDNPQGSLVVTFAGRWGVTKTFNTGN